MLLRRGAETLVGSPSICPDIRVSETSKCWDVIEPNSAPYHHFPVKLSSPNSDAVSCGLVQSSPQSFVTSDDRQQECARKTLSTYTFPSPYDHIMRSTSSSDRSFLSHHPPSTQPLQHPSFPNPGSLHTSSEGSPWAGTPASSVSSLHDQYHSSLRGSFDAGGFDIPSSHMAPLYNNDGTSMQFIFNQLAQISGALATVSRGQEVIMKKFQEKDEEKIVTAEGIIYIDRLPPPPKQADYPLVRYWSKDDFTAVADNVNQWAFIEDESGAFMGTKQVRGGFTSIVRSSAIRLKQMGLAPSSWLEIDIESKSYVLAKLYTKAPFLRLCDNDWKADRIAIKAYASWKQKRKGKGDVGSDDDDADNNESEPDDGDDGMKRSHSAGDKRGRSAGVSPDVRVNAKRSKRGVSRSISPAAVVPVGPTPKPPVPKKTPRPRPNGTSQSGAITAPVGAPLGLVPVGAGRDTTIVTPPAAGCGGADHRDRTRLHPDDALEREPSDVLAPARSPVSQTHTNDSIQSSSTQSAADSTSPASNNAKVGIDIDTVIPVTDGVRTNTPNSTSLTSAGNDANSTSVQEPATAATTAAPESATSDTVSASKQTPLTVTSEPSDKLTSITVPVETQKGADVPQATRGDELDIDNVTDPQLFEVPRTSSVAAQLAHDANGGGDTRGAPGSGAVPDAVDDSHPNPNFASKFDASLETDPFSSITYSPAVMVPTVTPRLVQALPPGVHNSAHPVSGTSKNSSSKGKQPGKLYEVTGSQRVTAKSICGLEWKKEQEAEGNRATDAAFEKHWKFVVADPGAKAQWESAAATYKSRGIKVISDVLSSAQNPAQTATAGGLETLGS